MEMKEKSWNSKLDARFNSISRVKLKMNVTTVIKVRESKL